MVIRILFVCEYFVGNHIFKWVRANEFGLNYCYCLHTVKWFHVFYIILKVVFIIYRLFADSEVGLSITNGTMFFTHYELVLHIRL